MLAQLPILQQSTPVWLETRITEIRQLTATIRMFTFPVMWADGFRAGQCVDFRLTAQDGYQAQRYYSLASAPSNDGLVHVMIERQQTGEVSSFLHDELVVGDVVEVRGPIGGGPFTWHVDDRCPILLIGGGSGVVPLLAMVRDRVARGDHTPFTLLYSAKTESDVLARDELIALWRSDESFQLVIALTREVGNFNAPFHAGRFTPVVVQAALTRNQTRPELCFICGSDDFVGDMSDIMLGTGMSSDQVRTERFGG